MNITVSIDTREFEAAAKRLGPRIGAAMAKALNRTAFELRDAESAETRKSFTLRRLRPGFKFDGATAQRLEVVFRPQEQTEHYLAQHVAGGTVSPGEGPERLTVGGEFAVPVGIQLGPRGRVPERRAPAALLKAKRGFIAKGVLFERRGRRKARENVALYALVPQIRLDPRFAFYTTAKRTAQVQFPIKARQEFDRAAR